MRATRSCMPCPFSSFSSSIQKLVRSFVGHVAKVRVESFREARGRHSVESAGSRRGIDHVRRHLPRVLLPAKESGAGGEGKAKASACVSPGIAGRFYFLVARLPARNERRVGG